MILYNWSFILLSSGRLLKPSLLSGVKRWTGLVLIAAAITGTLFHALSRPGFYISLLIVALIALSDWLVQHFRNKQGSTDEHHALAGGPEFRIKGIRLRKNKV
jgi:L-asparagine transporter-like permease